MIPWIGHKNRFSAVELAFKSGHLDQGLAYLAQKCLPASKEILIQAERLTAIRETESAAQILYQAVRNGAGDSTLLFALDSLGDLSFKPNWRETGRWIPPRLYHFTDLSNLPQILEYGSLYSRNQLEIHQIEPASPGGDARSWAGDLRKGLQNHVHLAVRTPHPMLFAASKRIPRPVYLALDSVLALSPDVLFSDRNANDSSAFLSRNLSDFRNFVQKALSGMYPSENKGAIQSEVLIPREVRLNPWILHGIYFRSDYERKAALSVLKDTDWKTDLFQVNEEVFIC